MSNPGTPPGQPPYPQGFGQPAPHEPSAPPSWTPSMPSAPQQLPNVQYGGSPPPPGWPPTPPNTGGRSNNEGSALKSLSSWFTRLPTLGKVGVGCGSLIAVCMVCSLCGAMLNFASGNGPSTGNTANSSNSSGNVNAPNNGAADKGTTATVGPTATPRATATPTTAPKWTTIQSFKGNGNKKTASFSVPDTWQIAWTCNPSSSYIGQYNVIVDVYNSDGTDYDLGAINTICQHGNTGDSTQERGSGDVYLDVQSEGAWVMNIQVYK